CDAGVTRRAEDLVDITLAREFPHERMFPGAAAHHQQSHALPLLCVTLCLRPSGFLPGPSSSLRRACFQRGGVWPVLHEQPWSDDPYLPLKNRLTKLNWHRYNVRLLHPGGNFEVQSGRRSEQPLARGVDTAWLK